MIRSWRPAGCPAIGAPRTRPRAPRFVHAAAGLARERADARRAPRPDARTHPTLPGSARRFVRRIGQTPRHGAARERRHANLQRASALQRIGPGYIRVLPPSRARRRLTCAMSLPLVGGAGDASRPLVHCTRFWLTVQLEKRRPFLFARVWLAGTACSRSSARPVPCLFELVGIAARTTPTPSATRRARRSPHPAASRPLVDSPPVVSAGGKPAAMKPESRDGRERLPDL